MFGILKTEPSRIGGTSSTALVAFVVSLCLLEQLGGVLCTTSQSVPEVHNKLMVVINKALSGERNKSKLE